MTDDREPADDEIGEDDEVLSGELVDGEGTSKPLGRWSNVVGYACIGLVLVGIVLFSASVPRIIDPEAWICSMSRAAIDDANEDDDTWNDVDLGEAASADDLTCDDAVRLAGGIPTSEDGDDTLTVASPSTTRSFAMVGAALGLLQVVGGLGTAVTHSRAFRRVAISSAIVGLIAPVLGILSLLLIGFVIWAITFSPTAKQIWGELSFLGGSRRSRKA